jgi:hypothetical protein
MTSERTLDRVQEDKEYGRRWLKERASAMEITRAQESDYEGILGLQSRCFIDNLSPEEREDGFVSAEFSWAQIAAMASGLGIIAAKQEERIIGYICVSRLDFMPRPPLLDSFFHCLEGAVLHGTILTKAPLFVYGPVCIDREFRGTGLLRLMFSRVTAELADRFKFGVAFVAADNRRSLRAHMDGLGMIEVGLFTHGGSRYHALAFTIK